MSPDRPYLSVVATARNDDHGGNLLRRLQIFVNALAAQSKRHAVSIELVLVEWNPPPEKPPLVEALRWPAENGPCRFRVITVAPELHRRYRYSQDLPLYQMIAKNVGIRRAEGEFILATNIDIIFSDELMEFLAARRLEQGRMYRIDRHDVAADVPLDASMEEQLAYCRTHRIRLNSREGTFGLTPEGYRALGVVDVAADRDGIFFGGGWHAPEQCFGQVFRWAGDRAEAEIRPSERPRTLVLETEAGPGAGFAPFTLALTDRTGRRLHEAHVPRHSLVRVQIAPGADFVGLDFTAIDGANASGDLKFRVLRCAWEDAAAGAPLAAPPALSRRLARARQTVAGGARFLAQLPRQRGAVHIGLPFSGGLAKRLQLRSGPGGASLAIGQQTAHGPPRQAPAALHTNACGDFTLAHRSHWFELRGYPEFDLHSMNLDSIFCYMAHYGGARESILEEPMRIYHIEHAAGSGWTPEGQEILFQRLAAKGIQWMSFEEVIGLAGEMERLKTTMVFNREDWGLNGLQLTETIP